MSNPSAHGPAHRQENVTASLSIEEKRQIVYSSLLRFAPEAASLRERALDKTVLGSLIGSLETNPYRIGTLVQNLKIGPAATELRVETIQESLSRLIKQNLVSETELLKRNAYFLTAAGERAAGQVIHKSEELFGEVLKTLLKDTESVVPFDVAANVFRAFTFECFARFGQLIAKNVTGQMTNRDLIRNIDLDLTFNHVVADKSLTPAAKETLKSRCLGFLRSANEADQKLKFYLTQGYYFTKLLGLETGAFDPLNEHAFAGSAFYLDTNILLAGIIPHSDNEPLFAETTRIAARLGIELKVTRATIDEARRVAAEHLQEIKKVIDTIPEELIESRTKDEFLLAYFSAHSENEDLTPEEFVEPFSDLPRFLKDKWSIELEDITAEEAIEGRNVEKIGRIINESATRYRGWPKSEGVLEHDVAHCLLVEKGRTSNSKTWFLTRDATLLKAAEHLAEDGKPFCFSFVGFLHSVSPFLATQAEEQPFVEVFSSFISDQVFPVHNVFDAKELALMAEYHEDVMKTPVDQLTMAFDYVKTKTLQGRPYTRNDIPAVSLELKKFLANSRDEQIFALEQETARLAAERELETQKRIEAEKLTERKETEIDDLMSQIAALKNAERDTNKTLDDLKGDFESERQIRRSQDHRRRLRNMIIGFVFGILVWSLDDKLLLFVSQQVATLEGYEMYLRYLTSITGAMLFSIPAFGWVAQTGWPNESKVAFYTVTTIVALSFSQLFSSETISTLSDYLGVGGFIGAIILVAVLTKQRNTPA